MSEGAIVFENVSRFYGEVLGINRVNLTIPPGVTSLVGPNGSGKTTLMNLMTGLLRPTRGQIRVLGIRPDDPGGKRLQGPRCKRQWTTSSLPGLQAKTIQQSESKRDEQ